MERENCLFLGSDNAGLEACSLFDGLEIIDIYLHCCTFTNSEENVNRNG